ncbi:hypothetical protein H0A73_16485 [Alcaligenaceae bacterium]|nr:hypothetical protein [Alcaligenaceae bacterium]
MANPYFNAQYYLTTNQDVFNAGINTPEGAWNHYVQYGAAEGRSPTPWFDSVYYLNQNPDLATAGLSASELFDHFTTYGIEEGRQPSADANVNDATLKVYAEKNADLQTAFGIDDLDNITPEQYTLLAQHLYAYGYKEDRDGNPIGNAGDTFTLTTDADDLSGTDGNDVFVAPLDRGILPVTEQTLQSFDTLDGRGGYDVLEAQLNGFSGLFDAENPVITNIEQYDLTVASDSAWGGLDLARASGYEVLHNLNSRGDLDLGNVNLSDEGDAPAIWLTNVRGNTGIDYDSSVSAVDVQNVVASQVGSAANSVNLRVDVIATSAGINTLNLDVSNGVYLNLSRDAQRVENLNITGQGVLALTASTNFVNLVALDSVGYTGNLSLDVSGSADLETVDTGIGNDRVVVSNSAVDGELAVDMGEGENVLAVAGVQGSTTISGLDFTGGVENVQTLEFTDHIKLWHSGVPSLDLTGFDENLGTVLFSEGLDGNGNELTLISPNADLALVSNGDFDDVDLHTVGVQNLTISVDNLNGWLDIDNLSGAELETLTLNQTNGDGNIWLDITSDAAHDVTALQSITATAVGDASVEIDASGADADVNSLTTINVTSTGGDAGVELQGVAGQPFVAGVQQVQGLEISTSAGVNTGLLSRTTSGQVTFASDLFPGGTLTVPYHTQTTVFNNSAANHTAGAINDIIAVLNAGNYGFTASSDAAGKIKLVWDDASDEQHPDVNIINVVPLTEGVQGTLNAALDPAANVPGEAEVPMEIGQGFEALTDIVVDAAEDAEVDLTDVYGDVDGFTVNATAVEDVDVWLNNTGATEVTVSAGADAYIDVWGDTYGNRDLVSITVVADEAEVWLADDLASFDVLDVSNVATYVMVDASGADFGSLALGEFITYQIGATNDGDNATTDVDFTANIAREMFSFVADDIGNVVITDFTWGNDPVAGDRLDLSAFASNAGQLVFSDVGGDLVITDLAGGLSDFGGSITIVGAAGDAADVAAFNIIYG